MSLILQVLPFALGAAMSPTFLAMQVAVLTSPAPGALRRGWAMALGSMSMLLLLTFGGVSLLSSLPTFGEFGDTWTEALVFALAGLALLAVALFAARKPRDHKDSMLVRLVDAKPPFIFSVGALRLAVNASTLALYIPALHLITSSSNGVVAKGIAFLLLFLITESPVLGPVLAVAIAGERAKPALTRIHDGIKDHTKQATVALCLVFGVVLLGLAGWDVVQLA